MKYPFKLAAAALLAFSATGAHAQSAFDGSLTFAYIYAPDDGFDYQTQVDGSVTFGLAPSFDVQVDLGMITYEGDGYSDVSYGIHGIYALNDTIDLGAFFSSSNSSGSLYYNAAGVEAGFQNSAFRVDGFFAVLFDNGSSTYYDLGAEVGYTFASGGGFIGDVEVFAGANMEYDDTWDLGISNLYGGVNVHLGNNFIFTAKAADMDSGEYNYYTAAITYEFGNGSRFAPRDFSASFPGY